MRTRCNGFNFFMIVSSYYLEMLSELLGKKKEVTKIFVILLYSYRLDAYSIP